ncbi:MAG: polyphenol oxidase family protein [Treponema sp.]|nr:polyphenol oxidase family protein [Treponema sp.]
MNYFSIHDFISPAKSPISQKYILFPFYHESKRIENNIFCGLTLKSAGTMRFRWNETNQNRIDLLKTISENPVAVELIHSKTVYCISSKEKCYEKSEETIVSVPFVNSPVISVPFVNPLQGDGLVTDDRSLMPGVTVADCMPLYLYDNQTGAFGIVHSGWKGTGIVQTAIELMTEKFGTEAKNVSVVIGPHIKDCCYIVDETRAKYFSENFTPDCIKPLEENGKCYCGGKGLPITWNNGNGPLFRLSLEKANLSVLRKCGVRDENISVCKECTCCTEELGSNRRETAAASVEANKRGSSFDPSIAFTVMAAFVVNKQKS